MTIPMETIQAIDVYLEEIYDRSKTAGEGLSSANFGMAQIRGLENMIMAAPRFSEIINYIKNQTGKDRKNQWIGVAPNLIEQLETLETKANQMSCGDPALALDIKMRLAKGWGRQVITHCLYANLIRGGTE